MTMYDRYPPLSVELSAKRVQQWLDQQERTPKSPEEIAKMSPAEKIEYCRRFDQTKMPPWRDPRSK
jgi:hypothetical protein